MATRAKYRPPMGVRGEVTIETEERDYPLLFTNRAIAQGEQAVGKSILAMLQGFMSKDSMQMPGVGDVANLLHVGMEYGRRDSQTGGKAYQLQDAFDVLDMVGFGTVAAAVFEAIGEVLSYNPGAEDEEEGDGEEAEDPS